MLQLREQGSRSEAFFARTRPVVPHQSAFAGAKGAETGLAESNRLRCYFVRRDHINTVGLAGYKGPIAGILASLHKLG